MLLLGHIAWAYVLGKSCSSLLEVRVNPFLLMFLGVIPDVDLLLAPFGIPHRSITHSIIFWAAVFVPVLIKYRRTGIPYFLAVVQHTVIGDFIVSSNNALWPFNLDKIGLDFSLFSPTSITLEIVGLIILLILARRNHDLQLLLQKTKGNLLSIAVLLPVLTFILVFTNSIVMGKLNTEFMTIALAVIAGHIILAAFLLIPFVQGIRALSVVVR